jgi:hypothetical protein
MVFTLHLDCLVGYPVCDVWHLKAIWIEWLHIPSEMSGLFRIFGLIGRLLCLQCLVSSEYSDRLAVYPISNVWYLRNIWIDWLPNRLQCLPSSGYLNWLVGYPVFND